MTRRHLSFPCAGDTLVGTLDEGDEHSGLLIVSGGSEPRCGAFGWQSDLARHAADAGFPAFRFDRRGVGDSEGENRGFRSSGPDILSAIAAFRRESPQIHRVVAFGNCDAASALMLLAGKECDFLGLSNPWSYDDEAATEALPPPAAIRARYSRKLLDPAEWKRVLRGEIDFGKFGKGLRGAFAKSSKPGSLYDAIAQGLDGAAKPYMILIAERDRTGQAFASTWDGRDGEIRRCPDASHAYVERHAREWLHAQVLDMLRG